MEILSRRVSLVHHKLHHWDNAIGKAFTEDPQKLRSQRGTEQRVSQHINLQFFHLQSGSKEVTGKTLRLTKKQNDEALSEMLKTVARLGVSGATNLELEKEKADVSRCCLLLLQLETWLDIAGGNDFLDVPAQHLGAVQISNEMLDAAYRVVRLRFPTAQDAYDLLQRIEGDLDMMIENLAWTCAIDRRLLNLDAGFTRLIDICCSVRVRKAVTSEREAFVSTFDQAAQTLRQVIAKLLNGYSIFLSFNSPNYAIIPARFEAVSHAARIPPLSVYVPHSLTNDAVASAMKIIFQEFQSLVPESLTLLVNPIAPDEILGMGKSARDPAMKGTLQHARDVKVSAAWKKIQGQENRAWAKRSRRSGAAGRYASILILQRVWRNYLACRDAVRYCARLAMLRTQRQAVQMIICWWRKRKEYLEMKEVKLFEAALRRKWVKGELRNYLYYSSISSTMSTKNNKILLPSRLISTIGEETSKFLSDHDDQEEDEDEENENENDGKVDITVSTIHESEKDDDDNETLMMQNENENENRDTPWRNIPIRWKQNQKKMYELNQNINAFGITATTTTGTTTKSSSSSNNNINANVLLQTNTNYENVLNISILSSTPSITVMNQQQQQQLFSPNRLQCDSIIFCAARRIQTFMKFVIYTRKIEEQRKRRKQQQNASNSNNNNKLPLAPVNPGTSSSISPSTANVVAVGSALNLRNNKNRRPSSATSSVLEKFRRIRREQQLLGDNYKWEGNQQEKDKKRNKKTNFSSASTTNCSSSCSARSGEVGENDDLLLVQSPEIIRIRGSTCLSSIPDEDLLLDPIENEINEDPIQRSLSQSAYYGSESDLFSNQQNEKKNIKKNTTDSLTYHSLKMLSQQHKKEKQQEKEKEKKKEEEEKENLFKNNNNHHHHDPTASEHLKQKLNSIPIVFKIAKKGDGNILVRPDNNNQEPEQNQNENEEENGGGYIFNEEEFKKQLLAQTGKTEIDQEELDKQRRIAEKYIEDVERLENHRSDEIVLSSMRSGSSKLLLCSVATIFIGKVNFEEETNAAKTAQTRGFVPIEERPKWIVEELRQTVARLRKNEKIQRKVSKTKTKRRQNKNDNSSPVLPVDSTPSRVLSSDDEECLENSSILSLKKQQKQQRNSTSTSILPPPALISNINNNSRKLELLSPIRREENEEIGNQSFLNNSNNNNSSLLQNQQQQHSLVLFSAPSSKIEKFFSNSSAVAPLLKYKISHHDLRHPYQNWSNATQILRTIVRRGLLELVAFIKTQDLRGMFQFSEEEVYRKEIVVVAKKTGKWIKKKVKKQKKPKDDMQLFYPDDDDDDDGVDTNKTATNNEEEIDVEETEDVEEERFVIDEMAVARQKEQARESTLQLICETAQTNSLMNAIAILSSDISKLVADENLPVISILRTMLKLESRRLIVPWIILVGAGKEFNEMDPEVVLKKIKREEHEAKIRAQKQRRSRRESERQIRKQEAIFAYQKKCEALEKELAYRAEMKEERRLEKIAVRQIKKENRLKKKKERAEQKKFKATMRAMKKELKQKKKELKEKGLVTSDTTQLQPDEEKEKENINNNKKTTTTTKINNNNNTSTSSPVKKNPTLSPTSSKPVSRATSAGKTRTSTPQKNNNKEKDQQSSPVKRSSSSASSSSSSSLSSSVSSISTTPSDSASSSSDKSHDFGPLPEVGEPPKFDDDEEENDENRLLLNRSSSTIDSYKSSTCGENIGDDDDDEEDDENIIHDDINSEYFYDEEQTEFDDQAMVISGEPFCNFKLTFDDLDRMKYYQLLRAAASNCDLDDFYEFVMKSPHSLVRRWLKIPKKICLNKSRLKRRIDLMMMGALFLPFLKTLQQWFESNFVFVEEEGEGEGEHDDQNHQDDDDENEEGQRNYYTTVDGNDDDDDHHEIDEDEDAYNDYLQNETFDEEFENTNNNNLNQNNQNQNQSHQPIESGEDNDGEEDDEEDGIMVLPSLVDTGRNENQNQNQNNDHFRDDVTGEERIQLVDRPEARLGNHHEGEDDVEEL